MNRSYVAVMSKLSGIGYIGVTNNLERRVAQHKKGQGSEFTRKYRVTQLVSYEDTPDLRPAIARKKQLKGWFRAKKVALIKLS